MHKSQAGTVGSASQASTRITILVDNHVPTGSLLVPEHGFSALIERGCERILFDTGQGPALVRNAVTLHQDLTGLSCVILSHGHYDHTGGLLHAVKMNPGIRVVSHPGVFSAHVKLGEGEILPHSIGIPHAMSDLEELGARFEFADDFRQISKGVWFTGHVPRVFKPPPTGALMMVRAGSTVPDAMEDDASLVLETASGPCLLLGCAHAGIRNILAHVRASLDIDCIHAVIGGTHLGPCDRAETYEAISALEDFNVQLVAPAHCTGTGPSEILREHFGARYCEACAGTSFEF